MQLVLVHQFPTADADNNRDISIFSLCLKTPFFTSTVAGMTFILSNHSKLGIILNRAEETT